MKDKAVCTSFSRTNADGAGPPRRDTQCMRLSAATIVLVSTLLGAPPAASAELSSDRPAALLVYPLIVVNADAVDTVVRIGNVSDEPIQVSCYYEDTNGHCTNTGAVCHVPQQCCGPGGCGLCLPGWSEHGFRLRLTPRQPIGWWASRGLEDFPLDGVDRIGPGGESNVGSRVPEVPERPFIGLLKCFAVDAAGRPTDDNVLHGAATLTTAPPNGPLDMARYDAIGLAAIEGAGNGDKTLLLGGSRPEYEGCPTVLTANHFFDLASNPVNGLPIQTVPVLAPCTQDLLRQVPGSAVVQYLVYNEFEQKFSTSRRMGGQQALPLGFIDTTDPTRSIFSAGAAGTLTGQTLLRSIGAGLLGVAVEMHGGGCLGGLGCGVFPLSTAAFHLHQRGDRTIPDLILLP